MNWKRLCAMGEQPYVLKEMKDYWGGMLNLGATLFGKNITPLKKEQSILPCMAGRLEKVFAMPGAPVRFICWVNII